MKYYKIDYKGIFEEENKVLGQANGEFVPNGAFYFDRIGNGEIIEDAPVFDYFHLQSLLQNIISTKHDSSTKEKNSNTGFFSFR